MLPKNELTASSRLLRNGFYGFSFVLFIVMGSAQCITRDPGRGGGVAVVLFFCWN